MTLRRTHTCKPQLSTPNLAYDQQPLPDLSLAALNVSKIQNAFPTLRKGTDDEKLCALGVCVPYENQLVPSIGGLLLFGKASIKHKYFPDARVHCTRFHGEDKRHLIDQHEITGTLLDAVEDVPKFIAKNTRLAARIRGMRREDIPEYAPEALQEVLINALAHADYSLPGATIQIAIFADRLEVHNLGALPFGLTIDSLKAGVSIMRNRVITNVFCELELMTAWGRGYEQAMRACRERDDPEPEWSEQEASMCVTFSSPEIHY